MEKRLPGVRVSCLAAGEVQLWSTSSLHGKKHCAPSEKAAADAAKHASYLKTTREKKDGSFSVEGSCVDACFSGVMRSLGRFLRVEKNSGSGLKLPHLKEHNA